MILATSIDFLKNLLQYEYNGNYYDFHNDYDCEKILLNMETLTLTLKKNTDSSLVYLNFKNVELTSIIFFNSQKVESLTLDNIYRGRFEKDGNLLELLDKEKAYFYIDFQDGQSLEFWAKNIELS